MCKIITVLSFTCAFGVFICSPFDKAQAATTTRDTLVTAGLGAAAGAVLGLSTIPFYGYPEDHLGNVFIGAGVGLVAGLGVALYLLTTSDHEATHQPITHVIGPDRGNKSTEKVYSLTRNNSLYASRGNRPAAHNAVPNSYTHLNAAPAALAVHLAVLTF